MSPKLLVALGFAFTGPVVLILGFLLIAWAVRQLKAGSATAVAAPQWAPPPAWAPPAVPPPPVPPHLWKRSALEAIPVVTAPIASPPPPAQSADAAPVSPRIAPLPPRVPSELAISPAAASVASVVVTAPVASTDAPRDLRSTSTAWPPVQLPAAPPSQRGAGPVSPRRPAGATSDPPYFADWGQGMDTSPPDPAAAKPAAEPDVPQVDFSHTGSRYVLGYTDTYFAIWDRRYPEVAIGTFPRDESGWKVAWNQYLSLEDGDIAVLNPPQSVGKKARVASVRPSAPALS